MNTHDNTQAIATAGNGSDMSESKPRHRLSFGLSIGDTVPLWGLRYRYHYHKRHRRFYGFAHKQNSSSFGVVGFKAGFIFVRFSWGRTA